MKKYDKVFIPSTEEKSLYRLSKRVERKDSIIPAYRVQTALEEQQNKFVLSEEELEKFFNDAMDCAHRPVDFKTFLQSRI